MENGIRIVVGLAFVAVAAAAGAQQTVWRCGASYSSQPCAGGAQVAVDGARGAGKEAASARNVALMDAKLADAMAKERLAREKNAPKALIIGPREAAAPADKASAARHAGKKHPHGKADADERFTSVAVGPKPEKAKK
jgi:hypothetical protein